jgi:hypothetical protein
MEGRMRQTYLNPDEKVKLTESPLQSVSALLVGRLDGEAAIATFD